MLLSDGEDTASLVNDEQVLQLARQADVDVYVIALRPATSRDRQQVGFLNATYSREATCCGRRVTA